jgi:hypothetical protein
MNMKNGGKGTVTKGAGRRAVLVFLALGAVFVLGRSASSAATGLSPTPGPDGPVPALIKILEVGRPVAYQSLALGPVDRVGRPKPRDLVMLDEAVKNGWIEIAELDGGRVPQVRISNLSKRTIYLMGGEILTGARQDRILASDLLLAPGTKNLVAPVFCVEHGRWTAVTPAFTTKNNVGTYDLRAKAAAGGVAEQNARVGVASPTGAYQDAYESPANKKTIAEIEGRMAEIPRLMEDTVGVVIGLGGRIVSADVFEDTSLFRKQWPKILRSAALSALGLKAKGELKPEAAADFLKSFVDKTYQVKKGLDLGMEYSCLDEAVNIQALGLDGVVIHLAAFAQEDGKKLPGWDQPEPRLRVIRDDGAPFRPVPIRDDN